MIQLENLKLDYIDYDNIEHLKFLKKMMQSKDIKYLWDLSDSSLYNNQNNDKFLVLNDKDEKIGYINISDVTEGYFGNTVSIYYGVEESYRGNGYGRRIVSEVNKWLFENRNVECVIAQVDIDNIHSNYTLNKAGMIEMLKDDDYTTFIQRRNR